MLYGYRTRSMAAGHILWPWIMFSVDKTHAPRPWNIWGCLFNSIRLAAQLVTHAAIAKVTTSSFRMPSLSLHATDRSRLPLASFCNTIKWRSSAVGAVLISLIIFSACQDTHEATSPLL